MTTPLPKKNIIDRLRVCKVKLTSQIHSRPTSVSQTSVVATLARLGPKRLTALIRKRRVAHPVRLKVKDVALGFVTF